MSPRQNTRICDVFGRFLTTKRAENVDTFHISALFNILRGEQQMRTPKQASVRAHQKASDYDIQLWQIATA